MDRLTKEQRRKNMQNVREIFGCPDIVFKKLKIAVFVDSEFWHGFDWENRKNDFKSNQEFWIKKIEKNILRDKEVNEKLTSEGWIILRFWGREIKKNLENCVKKISEVVEQKNRR